MEYSGATGQILRWYAYGLGPNDALGQIDVPANSRATFIPDMLGSVIGVVDGQGALTKIGYAPFGSSSAAIAAPLRFTGQRRDAETGGLHYYRARMYAPAWGRFMQVDPIGYAAGANLYAYVGNDPLNLVDPYGYFGFVFTGGGLIEAGLSRIFAQAGAQGSGGVAFLIDTSNFSLSNPANIKFSVVALATGGATAAALNNPAPPDRPAGENPVDTIARRGDGVIAGAYVGSGLSAGFTNANTKADLEGLSSTVSASVGLGLQLTGQFSRSDSGIYVATAGIPGAGFGLGLSASIYQTNTVARNVVTTKPK